MGVIIPESDMEFGTYQEKQVFRIEESEQYTKKCSQILDNSSVVKLEFIILKHQQAGRFFHNITIFIHYHEFTISIYF